MDHLQLERDFPIEYGQQSNYANQDQSYYQQSCRLYLANIILTEQVKDLLREKNQLLQKLHKLEDQQSQHSDDRYIEKAKRFRRTAHEIDRFYKCSVKNCEKSYGSEGSLNQHYKLKHPDIYISLPNVQLQFCTSKSSYLKGNQDQEQIITKDLNIKS